MALTQDQILDIAKSSLPYLKKGQWTDLTSDLQSYVAMPKLLKEKKVKEINSGESIRTTILGPDDDAAEFVGLAHEKTYTASDDLAYGTVEWRHATTQYSIDRRIPQMNSGAEKIVELLATYRHKAFVGLAKLLETAFWGTPTTSSDKLTPYGIKTYIVRNSSQGFNGGNPSGFSSGVVFDSTVQTRWKNWTDQYTAITKDDLVTRLRIATRNTHFQAPVEAKEALKIADKRAIYTNQDVLDELELLLEQQNENLGMDVAKTMNEVVFRKIPVMWVPQLDSDTQDPVYGINWQTLYPCFLKGETFVESKPRYLDTQPTVMAVDVDLSYNLVCDDRRSHFVVNKA